MLALSTDSGSTWTYVIDGSKNLPSDYFFNGQFNGSSTGTASLLKQLQETKKFGAKEAVKEFIKLR